MTAPTTPIHDITIKIDGTEHHGTYYIVGHSIFVRSPLGSKTTWIRHLDGAQSLAEMLLSEIVRGT